jgi:hypothetical protein
MMIAPHMLYRYADVIIAKKRRDDKELPMKKLLSLALGLGLGAMVGASIVILFAPMPGSELIARIKQGWKETMEEARKANELRRAELEAELAQLRGKTLPRLPPPGGTSR